MEYWACMLLFFLYQVIGRLCETAEQHKDRDAIVKCVHGAEAAV